MIVKNLDPIQSSEQCAVAGHRAEGNTAPYQPAEIPAAAAPAQQDADLANGTATRSGKICRFCGSFNLEIRWGRNHYFYCQACGKSTPIYSICPTCNNLEKLRKQGEQFFVDCQTCQTSLLYYTNP